MMDELMMYLLWILVGKVVNDTSQQVSFRKIEQGVENGDVVIQYYELVGVIIIDFWSVCQKKEDFKR